MGLLQNGFRDTFCSFRYYGATASNGACPQELVGNFHLTGMQRNVSAGDGIKRPIAGIPMGHLAPSSWCLPQKQGGMSAFTSCRGVGSASANGAEGIGISGQVDGLSIVTGQGTALSWGTGTANGSSSVTSSIVGIGSISGLTEGLSDTYGLLFASVNISGEAFGSSDAYASGSLAASLSGIAQGSCEVLGSMSALLNMVGTAYGSGNAEAIITGAYFISGEAFGTSELTASHLDSFGWMVGQANGDSDASANPFAYGFMSGTTDVEAGALTADGIAVAVWSYER